MSRFQSSGGWLKQLLLFAWTHKAYWIVPAILVLVVLIFIIMAGSGATPFLYGR